MKNSKNYDSNNSKALDNYLMDAICILRSLADIDAFQSGRFAEQNGRSKTLKYQVNLAVESLLYSAL